MLRTLPIVFLLAAVFALTGCTRSDAADGDQDHPLVTVYLTPTCGCCKLWADHMEEEGFPVRRVEVANLTETKLRLGVPAQLGSCHTATVGDYVVEGHVPADDVRRLLAEQPDAAGIAVPAMPIGSPGMEVPGREPESYAVYLFTRDGRGAVFSRH